MKFTGLTFDDIVTAIDDTVAEMRGENDDVDPKVTIFGKFALMELKMLNLHFVTAKTEGILNNNFSIPDTTKGISGLGVEYDYGIKTFLLHLLPPTGRTVRCRNRGSVEKEDLERGPFLFRRFYQFAFG